MIDEDESTYFEHGRYDEYNDFSTQEYHDLFEGSQYPVIDTRKNPRMDEEGRVEVRKLITDIERL